MSEQTPLEQPPQPEAAPGDRWGDPISEERKAELEAVLQQWEGTAAHGEQAVPFAGVRLSGADVFWLAVCALAGGMEADAAALVAAEARLRDERRRFSLDLSALHLEAAYLRAAHLEGASLRAAHLEGAYLRAAHLEDALPHP